MLSLQIFVRTFFVIAVAQLAVAGEPALADPPARVARLAYIDGTVSFAPAGEDEWVVADPNRPLVTGDRVWSDAASRTELQIGFATLRFGATTSATVLNLDDRIAQFEVAQGTVYVSARNLPPGETIEIDTPNLALTITRPGAYRIDVDPNGDSTAVGVRSGEANVYGEGAAYIVPAGQWYRFYATGLAQRQHAALPAPDAFDQWAYARDRRYDNVVASRYVAPEVIGYEDLDAHGTWTTVPEYGPVWTPNRVASDWAPYRDGRWSWIDPWGWTWVDAAPWGFAPYHYGRWAYMRERWYWVPGPRTVRPVYAPALVAFVGDASFRLTIGAGPAAGVAWFPLAPGEVYRPAYRASREYFTRVNVSNTRIDTTIINNYYNDTNVTNIRYRNREAPRGVTAVASDVFAQSRPVAPAAVSVSVANLQQLQVNAIAPVAPSRKSVLGDAQPARAKPSKQVMERPVVAKTRPPAAPAPFEVKEPVLAKQPGRPLDSTPPAAPDASKRADAPKVKVVENARPPEPAPKGSDSAPPGKAAQPGTPPQGVAGTTIPNAPAKSVEAPRAPENARAQEAPQPAEAARPPQKDRARDTARAPEPDRPLDQRKAPPSAATAPATSAPTKTDAQTARAAKGQSDRPQSAQAPEPPRPQQATRPPQATEQSRPQQAARPPQDPRREEQRAQSPRPQEQAGSPAPAQAPVAARPPERRQAEAKPETAKGKQEGKKGDKKDKEEEQHAKNN